MGLVSMLSNSFDLNLGKLSFSPSYIQAGVILLLLFILVLTLAQLRRHFVDWSFKGALFGLFFGFILALVLEGFLIVGGKTALIQVLGWKNAPKPLESLLEVGRGKLIQVLGEKIEIQIPEAVSKLNPTFKDGITFFQSLNPNEAQKFKNFICKP